MTEIDVDHQINAVKRTLGARTIDTGEAHVVTITSPTAPTRKTSGMRSPISSAFRGGSCLFPAI
jgi:hypothetical protein